MQAKVNADPSKPKLTARALRVLVPLASLGDQTRPVWLRNATYNNGSFMEKQLKELFDHYSSQTFRTDKKLAWLDVAKKCMALTPA